METTQVTPPSILALELCARRHARKLPVILELGWELRGLDRYLVMRCDSGIIEESWDASTGLLMRVNEDVLRQNVRGPEEGYLPAIGAKAVVTPILRPFYRRGWLMDLWRRRPPAVPPTATLHAGMLWRDVPGADPSSVWHLQLRAYCRWHPEMPLWFYPWPAGPLDTSDVTPITRLGPGIGAAVCRVCDRYYFGAAAGLLDRPGRP